MERLDPRVKLTGTGHLCCTDCLAQDFNDGIRNNHNVADSRFAAVWYAHLTTFSIFTKATYEVGSIAIPLATFAYLGVELVTMTAFEAKDSENLKFPAKSIAWVVTVIYLLTTLVFMLNVPWTDPSLPEFFNQGLVGLSEGPASSKSTEHTGSTQVLRSNSAPVLATIKAGLKVLPGFITGCFIYSTLSTANTGLYVASRALFGLTREIRMERDSGWIIRAIARLSTVESKTRSPWWALLLSVLVLCWLPFQRMNSADEKLQVRVSISDFAVSTTLTKSC